MTFIEAKDRGRSSKLMDEAEMGDSRPKSPELLPELSSDRGELVLRDIAIRGTQQIRIQLKKSQAKGL